MRLFCVGLFLVAAAAQAQVHRCTDEKTGKVTYTDTPCAASAKGAQIERARSPEAMELERERAQIARERFLLEQEKRAQREQAATAPSTQQVAAPPSRADSYDCQVAKQNLGVGIDRDSRMKSQRAYEAACFGDNAAAIEKARAGATQIHVRPAPVIIHNMGR